MKQLFEPKTNDVESILTKSNTKYSTKIGIPQYTPSINKPHLYELCDKTKYLELTDSINRVNIPNDIKEFLKLAATRHLVFNYSKIADYYAHADKDVQELMEQSALVIIDVNDAIANGYMRLSQNIKKMLEETQE